MILGRSVHPERPAPSAVGSHERPKTNPWTCRAVPFVANQERHHRRPIVGTVDGADHFGIVAENIGPVKIGGTPLALLLGNSNDDFLAGIPGDFKVNEI